ncbi:MAG TPA: sulfite exporter TauE/SafE family protein [Alphaproteobacteria bacterium]
MLLLLVLIAAGFLGGVLNALAGGGGLVAFPALLFAGLNPIDANASSIVALMPGNVSSVWAYRRKILGIGEVNVKLLLALSLVGGLLGALLLLFTPSTIFARIVPWLMLFATLIFTVGNFAPLEVIRRLALGPRSILAAHFLISIYGGYFGGGIGFLILAALTLFGMRDINAMNGLKMAMAGVMTVASITTFIAAGVVHWPETVPMLISSVVGGYVGAHGAQKVDQRLIKGFVVLFGAGITAYFFWRGV